MNTDSVSYRREARTGHALLVLYCRDRHRPAGALCPACAALERYALEKLARCLFGAGKPVCAACPVHCYAPAQREQMRQVMRYAGPLMLKRHPWLALAHLARRFRRPPPRPGATHTPLKNPARQSLVRHACAQPTSHMEGARAALRSSEASYRPVAMAGGARV